MKKRQPIPDGVKQLVDANLQRIKAAKNVPYINLAAGSPERTPTNPEAPVGAGDFPRDVKIASQSLGKVPERAKEEEETPMRQSDTANQRRRKKGERLRPMAPTSLDPGSPGDQLRDPQRGNARRNDDIYGALGRNDANDDILAQI